MRPPTTQRGRRAKRTRGVPSNRSSTHGRLLCQRVVSQIVPSARRPPCAPSHPTHRKDAAQAAAHFWGVDVVVIAPTSDVRLWAVGVAVGDPTASTWFFVGSWAHDACSGDDDRSRRIQFCKGSGFDTRLPKPPSPTSQAPQFRLIGPRHRSSRSTGASIWAAATSACGPKTHPHLLAVEALEAGVFNPNSLIHSLFFPLASYCGRVLALFPLKTRDTTRPKPPEAQSTRLTPMFCFGPPVNHF